MRGDVARAAVAVGLLAAVTAGCAGSTGTAQSGATGSSSAAAQAAPTTPATPTTSTSAGTEATTTAAAPPPSGPVTPVPSRSRPTLPPAPLTATPTFAPGVAVHVVGVRAVTVTGRGPGELSGPAVAVTLRLQNDTARPLDLSASVVTADYGPQATPAVDSASPPSAPWRAVLQPGEHRDGTYVFLVPAAQRRDVRLSVSYDPSQPVILLRGAVTG